MKHIKLGILIMLVLVFMCSFTLADEEELFHGTLGSSIQFFCTKSGILTISGKGKLIYRLADEVLIPIIMQAGGVDKDEATGYVKEIIIEEGITGIGILNFAGFSRVTSVTLPSTLTSIDNYAFSGCSSLKSLTIPDQVTEIGKEPFPSYTVVVANRGSAAEKALGKAKVDLRYPGMNYSFRYLLSGEKIRGLRLTRVDTEDASFTVPDDITEIGSKAFYGCKNLKDIYIPDDLEACFEDAFVRRSGDTPLILHASKDSNAATILNKAGYAFRDPDLDYSLRLIYDGDQVIGKEISLVDQGVKSFTFPEGVISLASNTFYECADLESIVIPDGITEIPERAFYGCSSLVSIQLPDSITSIGGSAFYRCNKLKNINIPEGVTSIGSSAFAYCYSLESITLPDGVTNIGNAVFTECNATRYAHLGSEAANALSAQRYSFVDPDAKETDADYTLQMTRAKNGVEGYEIINVDKSITSITIPDNVIRIGMQAFENCENLVSVTIPDSVVEIGDTAFRYCRSLTSLSIPDSVISIGMAAFEGCTQLTEITLPAQLTDIDGNAFSCCSKLTEIVIPDTVSYLGTYVLQDCKALERVTLPDGMTAIPSGFFLSCSGLREIELPDTVSRIGSYAFSSCTSLERINIPEAVVSIGELAFRKCTGLSSITIPESVTSLGARVFEDAGLTSCYILGNQLLFDQDVFTGEPTIYCCEYSDADACAMEWGLPTVYLDDFDPDSVRTVSIPDGEIRIAQGETYSLPLKVYPDYDHPEIKWSVSDPAIAEVRDGVITALLPGACSVTISIGSHSVKADLLVYTPAEDFAFENKEFWTVAKKPIILETTAIPAGSTAILAWNTSDRLICYANDQGELITRKPGDAFLSAMLPNGASRDIIVHVCYPVTFVEFKQKSVTIQSGSRAQLTANVTMRSQSCVNHLVSFTSSDESIAVVDSKTGIVEGINAGTVTISAVADNGVSAECTVVIEE